MPYTYMPGALVAYDYFTGRTAGAALGGTAAPSGGTWTTSGAATDFAAADAPVSTDETVSRATASDAFPGRTAILGTTSYTDAEVSVDFYTRIGRPQVIVRYIDASNYFRAEVNETGRELLLLQRVAGTDTLLGSRKLPDVTLAWHTLRLVAYASGFCNAQVLKGGGVIAEVSLISAVLATGGALAAGKSGFGDYNPGVAVTRYYDNFTAAIPAPEPIVIYAGQSIEFRHDSTLRKDATGTYAGPPPEVVGGRFFIPNAGGPGRKARIAVMARRNDISVMADDHIADATTVEVWATPRYLVVPR